MNSFTYNGINSLALGLRIEKKDVYSAPKYDVKFQEIPGRDGGLIMPGGRRPNAEVAYTVFLEDELNKIGICKIKFSCKPYRYDLTGDKSTTISTSGWTITNPFPFDSKPYMKIKCTGNGSLTLTNGDRTDTWRLSGSNNFTEVDSDSSFSFCYSPLIKTLFYYFYPNY